jgi:hypothetical protein
VKRVKGLLKKSGVLEKLLEQILGSEDKGLPKLNKRIARLQRDLRDFEKIKNGFSEQLRQLL